MDKEQKEKQLKALNDIFGMMKNIPEEEWEEFRLALDKGFNSICPQHRTKYTMCGECVDEQVKSILRQRAIE